MNASEVIKGKFKEIKQISRIHLCIAIFASFSISLISVIRLPLYHRLIPAFNWVFIFLPPLIAMFLFYAGALSLKQSVFRSVSLMYYICTPFLLMPINDIFFNVKKAEVYSRNLWSSFMPIWTIVWWLGTIIICLCVSGFKKAVKKGRKNGSHIINFICDLAVMYTPQKILTREKREGKSKWIPEILCFLMIAPAVFILTVTLFLHNVYSNMEFEAILFTITFAAGGLAVEDLIAGFLLFVFFMLVTGYICYHLVKCFNNNKLVVAADTENEGRYTLVLNSKKRALHFIMSAIFMTVCFFLFARQTNFIHFLKIKSTRSFIYEKYYTEPTENTVIFPENKRNLIYIFLESMENTYASKENGGSQDIDYIQKLTELAFDKDSVHFSNGESLGGASVFVPAISHTMGSTVAQTSGITTNTMLFPIINRKIEFPPVKKLEDILHDNGYNQVYIEGSKGEFSLYDKYVGRYEDSLVYDRKALADLGYSDENADYIWKWGIEDRKLIEITKELITKISQEEKPFFVTMYTMDTHTFESGHRCSYCDENINNDYLASVECSSRSVYELVEWIKQQPFYENTTIMLVGDHLGNQKTSNVEIADGYIRTTYNCIINPAKKPANTVNRLFSSLDMFPTTLSSIGVTIKGDRLGLGTDLFSETPTLCEELGEEMYKEELERSHE